MIRIHPLMSSNQTKHVLTSSSRVQTKNKYNPLRFVDKKYKYQNTGVSRTNLIQLQKIQ